MGDLGFCNPSLLLIWGGGAKKSRTLAGSIPAPWENDLSAGES